MIDHPEITSWAERFGVAPAQIERDHFVSHVLQALSETNRELRFYGGTALCRTYLDETRLSEDVDLLHEEPRVLLDAITTEIPRGLRHEYPNTSWADEGPDGDGVSAFLNTRGVPAIKIYIGRAGTNTAAWNYASTEVQLRYSDLSKTAKFSCPTLSTFAAMKLSAWYDRHAPRDLFDLAGLAGINALDVDEVEILLKRKQGYGFIDTELARVPRATALSWEAELAAQVGVLPTPENCLARAAEAFISDGVQKRNNANNNENNNN